MQEVFFFLGFIDKKTIALFGDLWYNYSCFDCLAMYLPLPAVSIILSNAVRRCDMQSKEKLRDFFVGLGVGLLFFGSTIIFILNS